MRSKTQNQTEGQREIKRRYSLRTWRFAVWFCLFHGAATTKSGAARVMIEVAKRIVFIGDPMNAKKGWMEVKRNLLLETLV